MKEQLHKLMETEGLSPARFADEIGVQRSSISHIISGRNKPSYDFIMKILTRFKGINAEWLLTGQGSMIKGQESANNTSKATNDLFSAEEDTITRDVNNKQESDPGPAVSTDIPRRETDTNSEQNRNDEIKLGIRQFTKVNKFKYLLAFYEDGTFEQFNPRE